MAFKISYGNGALGDVENPDTTINSYARVTAVTPTTITINNTTKITGNATFSAGAKILIHVSGCSSTSVTYNETAPSGVTNVGGSTILIAAETIENFSCAMIAKYRTASSTAGQGICRCYIASETKLRNDEGLYAYDCLSNPSRIKRMNIKNFGNGSFGDVAGTNIQLNNYATITAVNGRKVTYKSQTTNGLAQIGTGALVMIHFNHKGNTNVVDAGRFILANVLGDNGSVLTLDTDVPNISVTDYAAQVVSIPQFGNFTLSVENKSTPAFDGSQGGICALACKGTCNLSGGKLNVEQKGGGGAYAREGLAVIGNAQDSDKLPIGQGHGSVFVLADKLTVDENTRIGATYSGIGSLWYKGNVGGDKAGSGAKGAFLASNIYGGYGSNGSLHTYYNQLAASGWQGAHILIVADTVSGLNQNSPSTGAPAEGSGYGGVFNSDYRAGYNGGGIFRTSTPYWYGGGSSGWCFIYCNTAVNQDTTGTVLAN